MSWYVGKLGQIQPSWQKCTDAGYVTAGNQRLEDEVGFLWVAYERAPVHDWVTRGPDWLRHGT